VADLPWFKYYPTLFDSDTAFCSNQAVGGWQRLLNRMIPKGLYKIEGDINYFARALHCQAKEAGEILEELRQENVFDHTENNGLITVTSRRLKKEFKNKENNRIRQSRFQSKKKNNGNNNANKTVQMLDVRSKKLEDREKKEEKEKSSSSDSYDIRNDKAEENYKAELLELDLNSKNNSGKRPESSSHPESSLPPSQDQRPESSSKSNEAVETENPLVGQFLEIVRKYPHEFKLRESEDSQWFIDRILNESQFKNLDIRDELDGWGTWLEQQNRKKQDQFGRKLKRGEKKHLFPESDFKRSLVNRLKKSVKYAEKKQNQENPKKSKESLDREIRRLYGVLDHAKDTDTEQFSITKEQHRDLGDLLEKVETFEQLEEWNKQFIAAEGKNEIP
jgi:hypothetical protein